MTKIFFIVSQFSSVCVSLSHPLAPFLHFVFGITRSPKETVKEMEASGCCSVSGEIAVHTVLGEKGGKQASSPYLPFLTSHFASLLGLSLCSDNTNLELAHI
jgi:hypothetical protein